MSTATEQATVCPNFINGRWIVPEVDAYNTVHNPSTG